jgi:transposase-like protein
MKNLRHAMISVWCPKGENHHADFRMSEKDGHFICNSCNFDFTEEMKELYLGLKDQFEQ